MEFDRVLRDEQLACDLGVGGTVDEEVEHVHFARGKVVCQLDGGQHVFPRPLGFGDRCEELDVVEHEHGRADDQQHRRYRHQRQRVVRELDADERASRFAQPAEDDAERTQVDQRYALIGGHIGHVGHDAEPVDSKETRHEIAYEEHYGRDADLGLEQDVQHRCGHGDEAAYRTDPLVPVAYPGGNDEAQRIRDPQHLAAHCKLVHLGYREVETDALNRPRDCDKETRREKDRVQMTDCDLDGSRGAELSCGIYGRYELPDKTDCRGQHEIQYQGVDALYELAVTYQRQQRRDYRGHGIGYAERPEPLVLWDRHHDEEEVQALRDAFEHGRDHENNSYRRPVVHEKRRYP